MIPDLAAAGLATSALLAPQRNPSDPTGPNALAVLAVAALLTRQEGKSQTKVRPTRARAGPSGALPGIRGPRPSLYGLLDVFVQELQCCRKSSNTHKDPRLVPVRQGTGPNGDTSRRYDQYKESRRETATCLCGFGEVLIPHYRSDGFPHRALDCRSAQGAVAGNNGQGLAMVGMPVRHSRALGRSAAVSISGYACSSVRPTAIRRARAFGLPALLQR